MWIAIGINAYSFSKLISLYHRKHESQQLQNIKSNNIILHLIFPNLGNVLFTYTSRNIIWNFIIRHSMIHFEKYLFHYNVICILSNTLLYVKKATEIKTKEILVKKLLLINNASSNNKI